MSPLAAGVSDSLSLSGGQKGFVAVIGVIAILALGVAYVLMREVLAADAGTPRMKQIALAVQEGAEAFLRRQAKTLAVFVVIIPLILLALPADTTGSRIGRSVFFVIGAALCFIFLWWKDQNARKLQSVEAQSILEKSRRDSDDIVRNGRLAANEEALKVPRSHRCV